MVTIKTTSFFSSNLLLIAISTTYHIGSEVYNPVQLKKTRRRDQV
ncbi:hypothetical protein OROHE_004312 [Orobanche hederae]